MTWRACGEALVWILGGRDLARALPKKGLSIAQIDPEVEISSGFVPGSLQEKARYDDCGPWAEGASEGVKGCFSRR